MKRTQEDIEKLKENWKKDPCWDIEDTEGFEDHVEELRNYRIEYKAKKNAEYEQVEKERADQHAERILLETGIADGQLFSSLHTFSEIEKEVKGQDRYIGTFNNVEDQVVVELMQAQVRATLLHSAQLKRIADALEILAEGESLSGTVKIWGSER